MQVLFADIVIRADDTALDQRKGTLDCVGVNIALGVDCNELVAYAAVTTLE